MRPIKIPPEVNVSQNDQIKIPIPYNANVLQLPKICYKLKTPHNKINLLQNKKYTQMRPPKIHYKLQTPNKHTIFSRSRKLYRMHNSPDWIQIKCRLEGAINDNDKLKRNIVAMSNQINFIKKHNSDLEKQNNELKTTNYKLMCNFKTADRWAVTNFKIRNELLNENNNMKHTIYHLRSTFKILYCDICDKYVHENNTITDIHKYIVCNECQKNPKK